MIRFDPQAVYTLGELQAALGDAVTVGHFLEALKVRKRFKNVILGVDLVRALEAISEVPAPAPDPVIRTGNRGRPRKVRKQAPEPITVREILTGRER
jgi:hypothetical protein